MRKLTWAAIGFGAGAFLAEYALPVQGLPYATAALALFLPLCFCWKGTARQRVALCLLAAVAGLLSWWWHYERHVTPGEDLVGQRATITAVAMDYPARREGYTELLLRVETGAPTEKAVFYAYGTVPEIGPGDLVELTVYVRSVMEEDGARIRYNRGEGEYLRGYVQSEILVLEKEEHPWRYGPRLLCQKVKELCDALFSPDTAPVMKALLTGDSGDLRQSGDAYAHMRVAGVLHIVAVSGMHLVTLMGMLELALGRSRRTSLLCLPLLTVFVFMAGCRASILRAAVMYLVGLCAPILERENDGPTSLGAALLVILGINPMAIGGVAFQLSFACMLGFVCIQPALSRWCRKHLPMRNCLVRFSAKSISASLCALVFSLPLSAYYFETIPLLAPVANLLTLPVVTGCFGAGFILCALGAVWPFVAALGAWVVDWALRWCMLVYDVIAAIPFSCLYTVRGGAAWWLVSVYAIWAGWYFLRRRKRSVNASVPVCLCLMGLCLVLLSGNAVVREKEAELTVLAVGQGQSVALLTDEAAVLVDCGGTGGENAGDLAANYLLASGKTRVDLLVLTHLHVDHANGVERLLSRIPVSTILLPTEGDDADALRQTIQQTAAAHGTGLVFLDGPCQASLDDMELTLYLPQQGSGENEQGIVVLAELWGERVYVMGDVGESGELALLKSGALMDADVLVVGHHGSKTASSPLFLKGIQAETAIISAGENSYGLPAEETVARLERYGSRVLCTREEGTITMKMGMDGWSYGKNGEKGF